MTICGWPKGLCDFTWDRSLPIYALLLVLECFDEVFFRASPGPRLHWRIHQKSLTLKVWTRLKANSSLVFFLDRVITKRDLTNGKRVACLPWLRLMSALRSPENHGRPELLQSSRTKYSPHPKMHSRMRNVNVRLLVSLVLASRLRLRGNARVLHGFVSDSE